MNMRLACLLSVVFLSACSIQLSEITPAPTSANSFPAATPGAGSAGLVPTPAPGITPLAVTPSPTASGTAGGQVPATLFTLPVTWAGLQLSGQIVFTAGTQGVGQLDLASGQVTTLFEPPDQQNSWVLAQAVSPDGKRMVIAYSPPPEPGQVQFGYTDLYLVTLDGAEPPQLLIQKPASKEAYFDPVWSPDGQYLYYSHLVVPPTITGTVSYAVERMAYPDGTPELVVDHAFWPRLSADGSALAFVAFDPLKPANELYVAAADGQNPRRIDLPPQFQSVDSPFFSPDGNFIYFSAITLYGSASLSWLDRLLGVQIAQANGSPADWWRVPVAGGQPERIAQVADIGMYGVLAPDGGHIAYISGSGLYVMNLDGTNLTNLFTIDKIPGSIGSATVNWLP